MIAIDRAHCDLIYGLVVSSKPRDVLELGWGTGASARVIASALSYNGGTCSYTLVDNWHDWGGKMPEGLEGWEPAIHMKDETEFCSSLEKDSYDFILSDADHGNAEKNADALYCALRYGGVLIFHDVCNPGWPNLHSLQTKPYWNSVLFDKNSRDGEECDRGLLVVFK